MLPKPNHLGPKYAAVFEDQSVVDAYHHRPTYPAELFPIIASLISDMPRTVLDVGCGTGDVARPLAWLVDRIDALDVSEAMLNKARMLPGADNLRINWILGRAEDADVQPPYALITAGQSLHWMDWEVVMPRFRSLLTPRGFLAIVGMTGTGGPWDAEVGPLCAQFSTNREYQNYDLLEELKLRRLFQVEGEQTTPFQPFRQPIESYIESFHARNGLSRDRMEPEAAAAFDESVRHVVTPYAPDGYLELHVGGSVVWGKPGQAS